MTHEYETVQSQKMQNKIDDVKKDWNLSFGTK